MREDFDYLESHRQVWARKPVLRRLYREQFYRPLLEHRAPGTRTLEIGSGPGLLKEIAPEVWRTDILPSTYIHYAVDAEHLPFASGALDNVIGLDVLHHINTPIRSLQEVARALRVGGRLILVEPWITPFSRFVYTYIHQETCDLNARPWEDDRQFEKNKKAFDGNPAIPYLLIARGRQELATALPSLQLRCVKPFCSLTYLLSFGFKSPNLLPGFLYPSLYSLECVTQPLWEKWAALRALLVWEKQAAA
jgi:SAM-dependent methyltransferase